MKLQEIYKTQIVNNLKLFNVVLGLSSLGNPSIEEFLVLGKKSYKEICKRKENKTKAIGVLMEICSDIMVMSEDCCFYNVPILDFKSYERPDYLLDLVLKFSSKDKMVEFINKDYKRFIAILVSIENSVGPNIKGSLSYIVMRNFLLLCELGLYRFAYYYACLIRTQIFIGEGLNPRVEYSDLFKSELSLAIKKEQNKYAKAISKKIKSGIVGALNKVPLVDIDEDNLNKKRDKKFVGEVISSTVGSDSNVSLESFSNSVDSITKKNEEDKTYTTKELIKTSAKNVVEDSKEALVGGAKAVGDKVSSVTKSATKSVVDSGKNALSGVKNSIDESLGLNEKSELDSLIEKFESEDNSNEDKISESHLMDRNLNGNSDINEPSKSSETINEVDSVNTLNSVDSYDQFESYNEELDNKSNKISDKESNEKSDKELNDEYENLFNEAENDEDVKVVEKEITTKKSYRLEKLNKMKNKNSSVFSENLNSPSKKPSRLDKLNKLNKSKESEPSKSFGSSSIF